MLKKVASMVGQKSILYAISDEGVKGQVFEALNDVDTYSLTWVGNGGDLLLDILDKDVDLAIIDENLAGIAGSKLVEIIKKSRPRIPLIIISSADSKEELVKVLEQGVFYFIMKPVEGEELRQAVDSGLKANP